MPRAAVTAGPDPTNPAAGNVNLLLLSGNNPDLQPETADVWSAGFRFAPPAVPDLSIDATWFRLDYEDKIAAGGNAALTLQAEERWAEIITRNPMQAQIDAICQNTTDFVVTTCPPNIVAIIDGRLRNLGIVRVRGIDFDMSYRRDLRIGTVRAGLAGTYTLDYETSTSKTAPLFDVLDTVGNPLDLKLRASAGWLRRAWSVNATVNYVDDYRDTLNNARVVSWTTVDLGVGYRVGNWRGLNDLHVQLTLLNALDQEPPFVNQFSGYDPVNAADVRRSAALSVTLGW